MLAFLWSLGAFIVALGILVAVHEWGHFYVARKCGVQVERFSIGFGKGFLFALGAGGQKGVEQILSRMKDEIRRDMILLGCKSIKELNKTKIAYR